MRVEIDRVPDGADAAEIENRLVAVLRDVREAVEDWDKMHERVTSIIEALDSNPPPLPKAELEQGQALLRWLADDHFTFLGYPEYRLAEIDGAGSSEEHTSEIT